MPSDHRCRLENFQRVQHPGHQTIELRKHETIDIAEDRSLRRFTTQHIELMPKDKDFGVQCRLRPEQAGHETPNQPAEIAHRQDYHPIRRRPSAASGLR